LMFILNLAPFRLLKPSSERQGRQAGAFVTVSRQNPR
jgi:hypothetical protein